jgi:beta-phosphoglucomutase-like phosphatase (HAD superfamily)
MDFQGVIFDADGVLVDSPHERCAVDQGHAAARHRVDEQVQQASGSPSTLKTSAL